MARVKIEITLSNGEQSVIEKEVADHCYCNILWGKHPVRRKKVSKIAMNCK